MEGYPFIKENTIVYEWKIHKISSRMEYKENRISVVLKSSEFSIRAESENKWCLVLFLNNGPPQEHENKDYLTIKIQNLEDNYVDTFGAFYILNYLNEKSNFCAFKRQVFPPRELLGYESFVAKEELLNNQFLIPNDVLTICAEVTVVDGQIRIPVESSLRFSNYQLVEDFKELYKSRAFSDMTIVVGNKKFEAHRIILMTQSPVLAVMFNHEMLEKKINKVTIDDILPDIFEKLLEYIYTDDVSDLEVNAAELLEAADKYQLQSLKRMCEESLCKSLNFENALKILDLADLHNAQDLMKYVIKCITVDAVNIIETEDFKEIEKSNPSLGFKLFKTIVAANNNKRAGI